MLFIGGGEEDDGLPAFFKPKAKKPRPSKDCTLCLVPLNMLNRARHCPRCGNMVCKLCCNNPRKMSVKQKDLIAICDECDHMMSNRMIYKEFDTIEQRTAEVKEQVDEKLSVSTTRLTNMTRITSE